MKELNIREINKLLPHRYPFLFVDRIIELDCMKRAVGIKNVSINEYYFQGHFPGDPVMPGVILTEAMAQVAGIMILCHYKDEEKKRTPYLTSIDRLRFRKPVQPGDQLIITADLLKSRNYIGKVKIQAEVKNQVVADGEFMFALVDKMEE